MKARIRGTLCEVEVVPYFPEGMFAGFTDVSGTLQPGMVVYKSSDLEFLETPPKLKPEVDWDAFRREAARDLMPLAASVCDYRGYPGKFVETAIEMADELIFQLRQEKK